MSRLAIACLFALGCSSTGKTADTPPPAVVDAAPGTSDVDIVAAAYGPMCWTRTNGAIDCLEASPPSPPITDAVDIDAGFSSFCVRTRDARVLCWNIQQSISAVTTGAPVEVKPPRSPFVSVALSHTDACAVDGDGAVWCWTDPSKAPSEMTIQGKVVEIAAGTSHYCVRRDDGTVACWAVGTSTPKEVTGLFGPAAQLAGGQDFGCARLVDGSVWCWVAPLAPGASPTELWFDPSEGLVAAPGLPPVVEIAAGEHHMCAREESGAVWCWGDNLTGECGVDPGQAENAPPPNGFLREPRRVEGLPPIARLATVRSFHTCVRSAGFAVWCWGDLGNLDPDAKNPWVPVRVVPPP